MICRNCRHDIPANEAHAYGGSYCESCWAQAAQANRAARPALKGVFTREVAVKAPEGFRPAKEA